MNLSEIRDPNAAGTWPLSVKAGVIFAVCAVVSGACVYYDTMDQLEVLDGLQQEETGLRSTFEEKQKKAASLPDYRDQLTKIEALFDSMLQQMPSEAEVATLLVDISQMGLKNGLDFKLFKPAPAVPKEFYAELPISIEVIGKYEEISLFISGLANLPRIVTIHDVDITPEPSPNSKDNLLRMKATVKTYNESGSSARKKSKEVKS